jgi:hypothetical protein
MKFPYAVLMLAAAGLAGCATTDQQLLQLRSENEKLKSEVSDQASEIASLAGKNQKLEEDLAYCSKRTDVLLKEKGARIEESAQTRKGVREFTDQVMSSLQTYFQKAEVVDYVGGELLERANVDALKNMVLVDLGNTIRADGTVIGGRAYLTGPSRLQFCLVRGNENGAKYSVVAITPPIVAADAGVQAWSFEVPMAAKKGDLVAVYLPDDVSIPYDDADTGHVVAVPGPVKLNGGIALKFGGAKNKRAYSFGVVGYFDTGEAATDEEVEQ